MKNIIKTRLGRNDNNKFFNILIMHWISFLFTRLRFFSLSPSLRKLSSSKRSETITNYRILTLKKSINNRSSNIWKQAVFVSTAMLVLTLHTITAIPSTKKHSNSKLAQVHTIVQFGIKLLKSSKKMDLKWSSNLEALLYFYFITFISFFTSNCISSPSSNSYSGRGMEYRKIRFDVVCQSFR